MFVILVLVILLCYVYSDPLRILLIGDSVDRYAVSDWCTNKTGHYCVSSFEEKSHNDEFCQTINNKSFESMFSAFGRIESWELSTCFHQSRLVIVTSIFNNYGVRNQIYCVKDGKKVCTIEEWMDSKWVQLTHVKCS